MSSVVRPIRMVSNRRDLGLTIVAVRRLPPQETTGAQG
jgi:hypothetical protein